jgi:hypothetical protein
MYRPVLSRTENHREDNSVPAHHTQPIVTAVALSTAYLKLGELTRRAFAGGEAFVLEKDRIPLVAIVSAREWLEYLAQRYPNVTISVRRTALTAPRVRRPPTPSRRKRPSARRAGSSRTGRRRPARSGKRGKR